MCSTITNFYCIGVSDFVGYLFCLFFLTFKHIILKVSLYIHTIISFIFYWAVTLLISFLLYIMRVFCFILFGFCVCVLCFFVFVFVIF